MVVRIGSSAKTDVDSGYYKQKRAAPWTIRLDSCFNHVAQVTYRRSPLLQLIHKTSIGHGRDEV